MGALGPVTFLAGLGCSIIYPTVISLVGISSEETQAEAISFAVAGGGVGLFAFPFLMSWISQSYGIKVGLRELRAHRGAHGAILRRPGEGLRAKTESS